jgi:hypothetical protein
VNTIVLKKRWLIVFYEDNQPADFLAVNERQALFQLFVISIEDSKAYLF